MVKRLKLNEKTLRDAEPKPGVSYQIFGTDVIGFAARVQAFLEAHVLPAEEGPRVRIERRDSDQAHLILGAGGYPLAHPDRYALSVLVAVLGGGMSSRLFTEVRERRGLAYYVFAHHAAYTDAGSLVVQAGVDTARIDLAVRITNDLDPNLIARPLGTCESVVVAAPSYLAAHGTPRRVEDLTRFGFTDVLFPALVA